MNDVIRQNNASNITKSKLKSTFYLINGIELFATQIRKSIQIKLKLPLSFDFPLQNTLNL